MKHFFRITILIAATMLLYGCTGNTDPGALSVAGLENYEFTMVQGNKPESGKPLVIEFWATWCGPCHRLFPHLNELTEDLKETDIQFVAVTNEPFNLTKEFVTVRKLKYPIASDIQDIYGRALNVTYIPFAVIVNSAGEIVWSGHSGKLSRKRIENVLAPKI
jgi:thiol-disulfide isomerase/thioredoxin